MPILNPEHLFEQAHTLIASSGGAPRQADLRRAVSSAYYGVFHATLRGAADLFVGRSKRPTPQYALVYRSVGHSALRALCLEVRKPKLAAKYQTYQPDGFDLDIRVFASAVIDLQEKRRAADYDPLAYFKSSDAVAAVGTARSAVLRFANAIDEGRELFLTLLLFPPR